MNVIRVNNNINSEYIAKSALQRAPDSKNLNARQVIMAASATDEVCCEVAILLAIGRATVVLVGAMLFVGGLSETMEILIVGGDSTGCWSEKGCCSEAKGATDISSCNITDIHSSNPSYPKGTFCR